MLTRAFRSSVDLVVKILVPLAVLALVMGVARVVLDLGTIYRSSSIAAGFDLLVTDILSTFVVVELLKSIVDYFEAHRLKLTFILDGALVFVLRETMIGLYRRESGAAQIAALAALLLALGAVRVAAVVFSPERSHATDQD